MPGRKYIIEVCEEAPVELIVNNIKLAMFLCTPQNLEDLAVGYLYNNGFISSQGDILNLSVDKSKNIKKVYIKTRNSITTKKHSFNDVIYSIFNSGSMADKRDKNHSQKPFFNISLRKLQVMARKIFKNAPLYNKTGGVHSASLVKDDKIIVFCEDIGRHNALDKVTGRAFCMGLDISQYAIISSGRIASDMVLKIAAANIPLIASRSITSSLALQIAKRLGITLIGRIAREQPIVYTHPWRVEYDGV